MCKQTRYNESFSASRDVSLGQLLVEVGTQRAKLWKAQTAEHQAIVVVPSYCLEREELERAIGVDYYEERAIWTVGKQAEGVKVIFVTSAGLSEVARDHLTSLLPPTVRASGSVAFVSVDDDIKGLCLAERLVLHPEVVQRIKQEIGDREAWLMPYFARVQDFAIGELLDIPVEGSLPQLQYWGTKSGSRTIFAEAQVAHPDGYKDIGTEQGIIDAIAELWQQSVSSVLVKINAGISGFGILKIDLPQQCPKFGRKELIRKQLATAAGGETDFTAFLQRFEKHQGVVEACVPNVVSSPSGQGYISATNGVSVVATHEQILNGQVYLGARFPADEEYRTLIQEETHRVGSALAAKGALGYFSVDFVVADGKPFAVEINLRQVGTLHYLHTAKFLRKAAIDDSSGLLIDSDGREVHYVGSDNLKFRNLKGLSPQRVVEHLRGVGLVYDEKNLEGVVLHMLGLVEPFGKVGCTAIASSAKRAQELFRTVEKELSELTK